MNLKKKKLLTNLVSSFLILISICLFIALLINLKFHQDCATVITGMLGVCATLYAPIAAFFLYDSWKEQKQYELEKQYAEDVLKAIISIKDQLTRKYYSFLNFKTYMEKKLIAINSLFSNEKTISISQQLNEAIAKFELLESISIKKPNKLLFENFEYSILLLNNYNNTFEEKYEKYYNLLPLNLKNSSITMVLDKNNLSIPNEENIKINLAENELLRLFEIKLKMEINKHYEGELNYYEFSYKEYKDNFEADYQKLASELIKYIKV